MVRAVPLAGGRSPGSVRSSARVLESRTLSMAALLGSRRTLVCILAGAYRGSSHGWRRDREWDGARCPPRWRPLAGLCALERARVLESRALSMAALLGSRRMLVCILAGVYRGSTHGWRRDREWDGARCPPRWRPLAGPYALERARARVADALDGCAARLTAHACVHPARRHRQRGCGLMIATMWNAGVHGLGSHQGLMIATIWNAGFHGLGSHQANRTLRSE